MTLDATPTPTWVRQRTQSKARVLVEALPYMREHAGRIVVVKVGGSAMADGLLDRFAEDVALLRLAGVRPIVVHGGGPQITEFSKRLGMEPEFRDGLRVTDADTLDVAKMVLVGKVNKDISAVLNRYGVRAIGLCGDNGHVLMAAKRLGAGGEDLGFVGDITSVDVELLRHLTDTAVPVLASIATDGRGQSYNIDADTVAAAIAIAAGAAKLIVLTNVPGIMRDGELVSELSVSDAEDMTASGVVTNGMVPKLESVIRAMRGGVGCSHVIDGRVEHALILELFTPEGIGTMITHDATASLSVAGAPDAAAETTG